MSKIVCHIDHPFFRIAAAAAASRGVTIRSEEGAFLLTATTATAANCRSRTYANVTFIMRNLPRCRVSTLH